MQTTWQVWVCWEGNYCMSIDLLRITLYFKHFLAADSIGSV